jgi:uncharacterized protein (TIGR02147 family)
MEFNWSTRNYREIVNDYLGYRETRRPRGAVKSLSEKLRCHPTFVAQVLSGRNNFSLEQGLNICDHFGFSDEETNYFLNLILRDRSGTQRLRDHFQRRLDDQLEQRMDLKTKLRTDADAVSQYEVEYFGNWMYQAVHALTQIKLQSAASLSKTLMLPVGEIDNILNRLEEMNLVKQEKSTWVSKKNFIHLPKTARTIRLLHASWRTKTLADLQSKSIDEGTHYSGVITATESDFHKARALLVDALGKIRKIVEFSESERGYVLAIDCYGL